jgi:hypothetical protein
MLWTVVAVLVAAGVYGNSYFAAESLLYRVLALVALALEAPAAAGEGDAGDKDARRAVAVLEYRAGSAALPDVRARAAARLRKATALAVIDVDDARQRYGSKLDADVVACAGSPSCIAGIGARIGARDVLLIGVSQFGDVILTIQRIDVATGAVLGRTADALAAGTLPDDARLLEYLKQVLPRRDFLRHGVLRILVPVSGATVLVNGRDQGQTPLAPLRVRAPATYRIRMSKEGYVPFEMSVAVPPDAQIDVSPALERRDATPWFRRWWVVALAGAVTVGAVSAVVITRSGNDGLPVVIAPF